MERVPAVTKVKQTAERVLVGTWNAAKKIPEKQEQWFLKIYDTKLYPRLTPEQQKYADSIRPKIEKAAKYAGLAATGLEAVGITVITAVAAKKGSEWVRKKRLERKVKTVSVHVKGESGQPVDWIQSVENRIRQTYPKDTLKDWDEKDPLRLPAMALAIGTFLHSLGEDEKKGLASTLNLMADGNDQRIFLATSLRDYLNGITNQPSNISEHVSMKVQNTLVALMWRTINCYGAEEVLGIKLKPVPASGS